MLNSLYGKGPCSVKMFDTNQTAIWLITFKIGDINTDSPVRMNTNTPVSLCSLKKQEGKKNTVVTQAKTWTSVWYKFMIWTISALSPTIIKSQKSLNNGAYLRMSICFLDIIQFSQNKDNPNIWRMLKASVDLSVSCKTRVCLFSLQLTHQAPL